MNLANKTILISGGSSGFGLELAHEFIKKEARVIICSSQVANLNKAKNKLKSKNVVIKKCDVRNYEEIIALISEFKKIDILVNCAGTYARGLLVRHTPQTITELLDINLKGLIFFTRAVLPKMITRNKGIIINVGSLTGIKGKAEQSIYAASKFGVRGFTEALSEELSNTKIKVIAIYPGPMDTPIYQKAGINNINYRRMNPKIVAQLIAFSLENSNMEFVNNIVINGIQQNFNNTTQLIPIISKETIQESVDGFSLYNKAWREGKIKKPVIILIGGHIGTGKTTFAEKIKERLPYASLLTTAIIRAILQSLTSEKQTPELFKHTYDLIQLEDPRLSITKKAIQGYRKQAQAVDRGLRKLVTFFESEGQLSIIEGNHILPYTTKELCARSNIISLFFESPDIKIYRETVSGPTHRRKMTSQQFKITKIHHDYIIKEALRCKQTIFKFGDTQSALEYVENKLAQLVKNA